MSLSLFLSPSLPLLPPSLLPSLACRPAAAPRQADTLFGGWFLGDLDGPINGTLPPFIIPDTNYLCVGPARRRLPSASHGAHMSRPSAVCTLPAFCLTLGARRPRA